MKFVKILSVIVAAAWVTSCGEKTKSAYDQPAEPDVAVVGETVEVSEPEYVPLEPKPEAAPAKPEVTPAKPEVTPAKPDGVGVPAGNGEPFVLKSLDQIKVRAGSDSPKVGDMIYSSTNLPAEACGTYWVLDADGFVETLAVCTGDHAH